MSNSMGHQARLAMDSAAPIDGASEPYEFLSEGLQKQATILDTNGVRGTRSHHSTRTRFGQNNIAGPVVLVANPGDLVNLLPRILGGNPSGTTFPLAETVPTFPMMIDRIADVFLYEDCFVSQGRFVAQAGGFVELTLDIIARTETSGQVFPSLTLPLTAQYNPYVFTDGVLSLQGGPRDFRSIEVIIDNVGEPDFRQSVNASEINAGDRIITVRTEVVWESANNDLYEQALAGASATWTLTNGAVSTLFTFATLQVPDRTPVVANKSRIPFNLEMIARMTGTTRELVVTNDSTP